MNRDRTIRRASSRAYAIGGVVLGHWLVTGWCGPVKGGGCTRPAR